MFKMFSFLYFVPFILVIITTILLVIFTKHKDEKFNRKFIFYILIGNLFLHLIKIFMPIKGYLPDAPGSIQAITPENICAVNVILFPVLYCFNNKYCNDAIVFIGFCSGVAAYSVPTAALNATIVNYETYIEVARYYLCHTPLIVVPVLMIANKLHSLSYRRFFAIGLEFMGILSIVFINALLLKACGIMNCTWEEFYSRNYCNPSMVFGPNKKFYNSGFNVICNLLVPPCFKYTTSSGDIGFIPVLWFFFPIMFLAFLVTLIAMIFDRKKVKSDYLLIKNKIIKFKENRKSKKETNK